MNDIMIYEGAPNDGFYVYSSAGCGDDCAIRIKHIQDYEQMVCFSLSPKEAKSLGKLLIKISDEYVKGKETGIGKISNQRDHLEEPL